MSRSLQARSAILTVTIVTMLGASACAPNRVATTSGGDVAMTPMPSRRASDMLASWPEKQRETGTMVIVKYGEPAIMGDRMMVWFNNGPFVKTVLLRDGQAHNFPMPHMDYLTQTVKHTVPGNKLDDLNQFDGSVWFHRTRGELSAQCDKEPMNLLALNLAHDVITGKRSVSDARMFYATTAMAFMQGDHSSPYVSGLMFPTEPNAADPDHAHQM